MSIKSVRNKFRKNKKKSQGSFNPKTRLLGQTKGVLCSLHTDTQTDTYKSEYGGHPFRVSGIFPSMYHQELVQNVRIMYKYYIEIKAIEYLI